MAASGEEHHAQASVKPTQAETVYTELLPTSPLDISALIASQRRLDGDASIGG
jgi:hypothetical protein